MKFWPFVLKILSWNEILKSINDHNSVTNLRNIAGNNRNLNVVNINAYIKGCGILSICSKDIEQKRNSDTNLDPQVCYKGAKNDKLHVQSQPRSYIYAMWWNYIYLLSRYWTETKFWHQSTMLKICEKLKSNNSNLDLVNVNAFAKFG